MSIAKNWCFTLNNYNEDDLSRLSIASDVLPKASVAYLLYQEEVGEAGTPHLQGFITFSTKKRIGPVKKVVGDRAHVEVAKGTPDANRIYCTKTKSRVPGTEPVIYGVFPGCKGQRTDIESYRDACQDGSMTKKRALDEFPNIAAKYPRFIKTCIDTYLPLPPLEDHPLRPWQTTLKELLLGEPNDREIIFVIDTIGNQGKTWFAKRHCRDFPDTCQYMEPGKKADMAYALEPGINTLFVNVTRQQVDHLQYSFLEAVKDGMVFSPKYESGTKYLAKMHVVVMMNQEPDRSFLSEDRYHFVRLD